MIAAWQRRAGALAGLAWQLLVNRTDAWGAYGGSGPWTAPPVAKRGAVLLTEGRLARHFAGRSRGELVGLHSTAPNNTCRWGAVDIDCHAGGTPPQVAERTAYAWWDQLRAFGLNPLLTTSNAPPGEGGYHLRVIFRAPVPSRDLHAFLTLLVADFAEYGLAKAPETFPKQPFITVGGYGNWLRLPGKHHSKEHWSWFFDGEQWLSGVEAVEFLLEERGNDPALLPPAPAPGPRYNTLPPRAGPLASTPIERYLAKLPVGLGAGQGRDDIVFRFGAFLLHDAGVPETLALAWLEEWDQRQAVNKGLDALRVILANARRYGGRRHES